MCQWETLGPRAGQGLSWSVAQSSWTWAHTPALSSTFTAVTQAPTLSWFPIADRHTPQAQGLRRIHLPVLSFKRPTWLVGYS